MTTVTSARAPQSSRLDRWLLPLLATAQLMLVLDVTVVNVALPQISRGLHLGPATTPWALTTYTVAFGGLMLLGGRLTDLYGSRRLVLVGLVGFIAASGLCATSSTATGLLIGRGLQGAGAALLSPAALAAVSEGPDRARALRVWSSLSGVGAAVGVLVGGALTGGPGWRWVFLINLPIGLVLVAALSGWLRQPAVRGTARLDLMGSVLVTVAAAATVFWLVAVGAYGWGDPRCWAVLLGSVAAIGAFVTVERRSADPLLRLELLADRRVSAGALLMIVATGLLVGGFFLGSFTLQVAHRLSALAVGAAFLPMAVATVAGAHLTGRSLSRTDTRRTATLGLALAGCGYAVAWQWSSTAAVIVGLTITAAGSGCVFVTAFTCALAQLPPAEAGLRSGLVNTFHEIGGALGVAALTTVAGVGLTTGRAAGLAHAYGVGALIGLAAAAAAAAFMPRLDAGASGRQPGERRRPTLSRAESGMGKA